MSLLLRLATEDDVGAVSSMIAKLLSDLGGQPPGIEVLGDNTAKVLSGELTGVWIWLAELSGRPVGMIALNECVAIYANGRFGEVTELYVDPEQRSAGVGAALLDKAKQVAAEMGWSRLEVGAPSAEEWGRTIAFYQREGFTEIGPRLRFKLA